MKILSDHKLKSQWMLLRAKAIGRLEGLPAFRNSLEQLNKNYPKTTASEKVEPKKKTTKKSPKKVEEAPVVVQPVQELTVEAIKEDEDDDDEESIETTIVLQEGVEYLHCAKDNKVYDRKTFDEIGYFSTEVNQVFLF